jgi:hypothetical protein
MDPEDSYDDEDSRPIFLGIGNIYNVNFLLSKGTTPRRAKYRHMRLDWKTTLLCVRQLVVSSDGTT